MRHFCFPLTRRTSISIRLDVNSRLLKVTIYYWVSTGQSEICFSKPLGSCSTYVSHIILTSVLSGLFRNGQQHPDVYRTVSGQTIPVATSRKEQTFGNRSRGQENAVSCGERVVFVGCVLCACVSVCVCVELVRIVGSMVLDQCPGKWRARLEKWKKSKAEMIAQGSVIVSFCLLRVLYGVYLFNPVADEEGCLGNKSVANISNIIHILAKRNKQIKKRRKKLTFTRANRHAGIW